MNLYYDEGSKTILDILAKIGINLTEIFINEFLAVLSDLGNYYEEDRRVSPMIIIGNNLKFFFNGVTGKDYQIIYTDDINGRCLSQKFKSAATFCDDNWYFTIDIIDNNIVYGLFKKYISSGKGVPIRWFEDMICGEKIAIIETVGRNIIHIKAGDGEDKVISQGFISCDEEKMLNGKVLVDLSADIIRGESSAGIDRARHITQKMLRGMRNKVHGAILVIVKDDFCIEDTPLEGVELSPGINFYNRFSYADILRSLDEAEEVFSSIELFYDILNTDGITIMTENGVLRYYNVFYQSDKSISVSGGARKRAALGICGDQRIDGIISVYFQSQDGEVFYRRR